MNSKVIRRWKLLISYDMVREIWTADPRIGTSHTFVYDDKRGYGDSCLPKDISSLKYQADYVKVDTTMLTAIINKNKKYNPK